MLQGKKVTIKDVARHAGVGIGSVSRVINLMPGVSKAKKEMVEQSIAVLGYEPDTLARSLRTRKTHTVAFLVNDISNIAFSTIAKGIYEELEQNGFQLLLVNIGNERIREKIQDAYRTRKFDGMILSFPDEQDAALIKQVQSISIPYILLDREIKGFQADAVYSDYYHGIRQAAEYLVGLGHEKIGFITYDHEIRPSRESHRGYLDAMKLKDRPVKPEWIKRGNYSIEFGKQAFDELIDKDRVTAIIAGSNQLLLGCMEGVRERRMNLPEQVSLIGFEDSDFTRLMSPAITVVKRPLIHIGQQIAYLMVQRIRGNADRRDTVSIVVPTELVVRESCSPPMR